MSRLPPIPKPAPLDASGELAKLAEQLKEQARPILRDTLLHALSALPEGRTCGDCARCYGERDDYGYCSAFPPAAHVVDGRLTSRDPIVQFGRPACTLFQELPE